MQNPHRVTPPLMSEDTSFEAPTAAIETPSASMQEGQRETHEVVPSRTVIKGKVEMSSTRKEEQAAPSNPAPAPEKDVDSSEAKRKVKKSATAFRTISEVADDLDVQQHVLRFWETKFTQVKPLKRGGGRRYYRPEDVALLKRIHHLLYTEGYTIKGVQKLLKGRGKSQIVSAEANNENIAQEVAPAPQAKVQAQGGTAAAAQPSGMSAKQRAVLEMMLAELKSLRSMAKA